MHGMSPHLVQVNSSLRMLYPQIYNNIYAFFWILWGLRTWSATGANYFSLKTRFKRTIYYNFATMIMNSQRLRQFGNYFKIQFSIVLDGLTCQFQRTSSYSRIAQAGPNPTGGQNLTLPPYDSVRVVVCRVVSHSGVGN